MIIYYYNDFLYYNIVWNDYCCTGGFTPCICTCILCNYHHWLITIMECPSHLWNFVVPCLPALVYYTSLNCDTKPHTAKTTGNYDNSREQQYNTNLGNVQQATQSLVSSKQCETISNTCSYTRLQYKQQWTTVLKAAQDSKQHAWGRCSKQQQLIIRTMCTNEQKARLPHYVGVGKLFGGN